MTLSPLPKPTDEWLRHALRLIGYLLLLLSFIDFIAILVPPQLTVATWEFQVVGELVERAPVPLLGLGFVLFGEVNQKKRLIFVCLARTCFVVGILFIALIPFGLSAAWRINTQNNNQVTAQVQQRLAQIDQRKKILNTTTARNLDTAFTLLNRQGRLRGIETPQALKERLFSEVNQLEQTTRQDAENIRKQLRLTLLKNSLKWNLGALFTAIIYLLLWQIIRGHSKNKEIKSVRRGWVNFDDHAESSD